MSIWAELKDEIQGIRDRDPAARSAWEIALCYPSFHAMRFYRVANWLWRHDWFLLGRLISQFGRWLTGIEIHPGATIGKRFFADHGGGVVMGEFSEVGDDVTLYQGVTLGGTSPSEDSDQQRNKKRHPTLGDNVIVGSGAQVLGPITVGTCARVGANAVVTKDVPPKTTVVGIPAKAVGNGADRAEGTAPFMAYGTPADALDPLMKEIEALKAEIAELKAATAVTDKKNRLRR